MHTLFLWLPNVTAFFVIIFDGTLHTHSLLHVDSVYARFFLSQKGPKKIKQTMLIMVIKQTAIILGFIRIKRVKIKSTTSLLQRIEYLF